MPTPDRRIEDHIESVCLTPEGRDTGLRILALYDQGFSVEQIAADLHMTAEGVRFLALALHLDGTVD